jgi:hypothetical protein
MRGQRENSIVKIATPENDKAEDDWQKQRKYPQFSHR